MSNSSFSFEVLDFDAGGRIGRIKIGDKILDTPNLFPVVNPFENTISPRRLYEHFGAQCLFTNAYIIYQNKKRNPHILEKQLHAHLDFPGIIATDSGGFQDYMYGGDIKIQPEEIEPFQEQLGSDCPVILDIPVQTTDSHEEALRKIDITIKRAKLNIKRRVRKDTAWFGPIHGSIYPDLLKYSTIEMSKLDFGIYAIGGVVKTFMDYRFDLDVDILLEVRKWLRPDRPLHMFGLGLPSFFALAVACGADTFDSAAYILYAKDDRYFTMTGTKNINDLEELPCHCPICTKYTAKELKKLPKKERIKAIAEHNLYLSFSELRTIRQAIREGTLWDLVEQRIQAHPKYLKAIKRVRDYPEYFDQLLNMNKIKGQKYLGLNSFYRAHIQRFRNKIVNFEIPNFKSLIYCLPELDLPSKSGLSFPNWFSTLKHRQDWNETQVIISSNLMGIIPLELSEMYPAAQHDGSGDMEENCTERKILLEQFKSIFETNKSNIKKITFLIPDHFINEYKEDEIFVPKHHIISYLPDLIHEIAPDFEVVIENSLSEDDNGERN
ncbi:MAG: tRNA guanosine(15) transglycosylase TgtA [Promethearchaeota archaeon]